MKTLIVYYSLSGNVEFVADRIANACGFDMLKLSPVKKYPDHGVKKFLWGGKSAVMAETPELEPYDFAAADYDRIILGFPVWASNIAPPIRTFVKDNDLAGKQIAAFACQSGAGAEKAFAKLKEAIGAEQFEAEMILLDPKTKPNEENDRRIQDFCEKMK